MFNSSAYELYRDSDADDAKTEAPVGSNPSSEGRATSDGWLMTLLVFIFVGLTGTGCSLFGRSVPKTGDAKENQRPEDYVSKAERFKLAFSRKNVKIHFVGAWFAILPATE
jgi:hypothetical protein